MKPVVILLIVLGVALVAQVLIQRAVQRRKRKALRQRLDRFYEGQGESPYAPRSYHQAPMAMDFNAPRKRSKAPDSGGDTGWAGAAWGGDSASGGDSGGGDCGGGGGGE